MRSLKARIGDSVVLSRFGPRTEGVLHVSIVRGEGGG